MRQPLWLASLTIVAAALCSPATYAGTYQTITIDGGFADWNGVPVLDSDGGDSATVDIGDVQIANDDEQSLHPCDVTLTTWLNPPTSHSTSTAIRLPDTTFSDWV